MPIFVITVSSGLGPKMKKGALAILISALTLTSIELGLGQTYRDNLPLPSFEILKKLLNFAEDKNFEKIWRTIQVIRPLTEEIRLKFGVNIELEIKNALAEKDKERVIRAIQQLVFLDMKDFMLLGTVAAEESLDKAKPKFKAAFLNYLLLSPHITVKSFPSDQMIKNSFQRGTATATGAEDFRRTSEKIERELLTVMPELK